jgi:DNA-binding GntR family transcriptional regulator
VEGINPKLRDPAWLQLARILESRIRSGHYPRDERLSSESELMREFEVGRTTVRLAIAELRKRGLVETVSTRGTYVVKELPAPSPG